jgi:hypothetical protein
MTAMIQRTMALRAQVARQGGPYQRGPWRSVLAATSQHAHKMQHRGGEGRLAPPRARARREGAHRIMRITVKILVPT